MRNIHDKPISGELVIYACIVEFAQVRHDVYRHTRKALFECLSECIETARTIAPAVDY